MFFWTHLFNIIGYFLQAIFRDLIFHSSIPFVQFICNTVTVLNVENPVLYHIHYYIRSPERLAICLCERSELAA